MDLEQMILAANDTPNDDDAFSSSPPAMLHMSDFDDLLQEDSQVNKDKDTVKTNTDVQHSDYETFCNEMRPKVVNQLFENDNDANIDKALNYLYKHRKKQQTTPSSSNKALNVSPQISQDGFQSLELWEDFLLDAILQKGNFTTQPITRREKISTIVKYLPVMLGPMQ